MQLNRDNFAKAHGGAPLPADRRKPPRQASTASKTAAPRIAGQATQLAKVVANTALVDYAHATHVARLAFEEYPDFDLELVKLVEAARENGESTESVEQAVGILGMLEAILPRERAVLRLLEIKQPEARLRSKITLILGRLTRSRKWVTERLQDGDPRVRANAVEALWGVNLQGVDQIFQEAAKDPHHRIVANAALGLYFLGDPSAVRILYAMLLHDDELFRRAAIWAAGQAGDARYDKALRQAAANGGEAEREAASAVLANLSERRKTAAFFSSPTLYIDSLRQERDRILAQIHCPLPQAQRWLSAVDTNALNFIVQHGRHQVIDYACRPVDIAGPVQCAFAIPTPLLSNAHWTTESWPSAFPGAANGRLAVLPFQANAASSQDSLNASDAHREMPVFTSDPSDALKRAIDREADAQSLERTILLALDALDAQVREHNGRAFLFLLAPPGLTQPLPNSLWNAAAKSSASIHILAANSLPAAVLDSYRRLSRSATSPHSPFPGSLTVADSATGLPALVLSELAQCAGRFELSWPAPSHPSGKVKIAYCGRFGYAEAFYTLR